MCFVLPFYVYIHFTPLCQCFLAGKPGRLSPHLKDGDPIDVLVLTPVPLITGSVVRCRPIGVLKMTDESGDDAKVLAVPIDRLCKAYRQVHDFRDLSPVILDQIAHFF